MKKILRSPTFYVVLVVAVGLLYLVYPSGPGQYDEFAACLTDAGVKMYGTDWCSHCQNQKASFGKSFKLIDFVDCDRDKAACSAAGVTGYPTWVINGQSYSGEQSLVKLGALAGCAL